MAIVDGIIAQFEAFNADLIAAIEACTEEQWSAIVPEEDRSAAVMFHHIVSGYPFAAGLAVELVAKKELSPITMETIHEINSQHADQHASVTKEEVLRALRENKAQTIRQIKLMTDAQMEITASFALMGGQPISVQNLLTFLLLDHGIAHFKAVKTAVNL